MKNCLKRSVQKLLVKRRHRIYEERIARQAVPYGVWLEGILEQEKAEILQWKEKATKDREEGLSVSVLSMREFCACVWDKTLQKKQGDIWLVTSEASYLVKEAAAEVERYFLEHPACGIAYGDEDGYFKPDWSPDLLQSFFYFGNVFAVRKTLMEKAIGRIEERSICKVRELPKGEEELFLKKQLYEMVLCCIDEAKEAGHVEKILFLSEKMGEEQKKGVISEGVFREDWGMQPEFDEIKKGHLYSDAEIPKEKERQELVSVIIPSKDNPAVLSKCIHSLREQTNYQNIEIIVIDNGSNDKNKNRILQIREQLKEEYSFRYLYQPMAFNFSAMCNIGARQAQGKYLLFLNDDMEIVRGDWLCLMLAKAAKSYVGAVGAKLLYPDSDKIQHVGITNIHLGPAHKLQFSSDKEEYYHGFNRHAVNVSGVTGACLLVRKEVFEEAGGFEEKLQVAFNDVEFCFHLLKKGYQNVCCNQTFLYHHESLSRGFDAGMEKVARMHKERDFLYAAYPEMWNRDAYYSKKLVSDILDRGFIAAHRFEEKRISRKADVIRMDRGLSPEWHNECLYMGFEFVGDESAWKTGRSGGGDYYIQGWSYAVNVDNSRYEKSLLLKPLDGDKVWESKQEKENEQKDELWKIPYEESYRPDFEENLPYIDHPALCGMSVWIARDALLPGKYVIGYLWEDACSRQKLCGFSAETLTVKY